MNIATNGLKHIVTEVTGRVNKDWTATQLSAVFPQLNAISGGFQPGVYVLAGVEAVGKTALLVSWISHLFSATRDITGLIFTPGRSKEDLAARLISCTGDLPYEYVAKGELDRNGLCRIETIAKELSSWRLQLLDTPLIDVAAVEKLAREIRAGLGPHILFIDEIQLVRDGEATSRTESGVEVMRKLNQLSRELGMPVVITSRLNIPVERFPQPHDFRQAEVHEQYADVIMILRHLDFHPLMPDTENILKGQKFLTVVKNRFGPLRTIPVQANFKVQKFYPLP